MMELLTSLDLVGVYMYIYLTSFLWFVCTGLQLALFISYYLFLILLLVLVLVLVLFVLFTRRAFAQKIPMHPYCLYVLQWQINLLNLKL